MNPVAAFGIIFILKIIALIVLAALMVFTQTVCIRLRIAEMTGADVAQDGPQC